ncbi:ATP-binding cassette domain-containing protein [Lacticaseibacillus parakribbianus]|uniref:ATP-binding cassette domain-containing protein n=1 Tax=Lacticaseibacillus parakribbianus TaxID=2970927 RepID=UPI0021CB44D8|nr:ABC transporter ATP-binding protein [Lacticaseibacillus parakribbianus]
MFRYLLQHPWRLSLALFLNVFASAVLVGYAFAMQLITDIATGRSDMTFAVAVPVVVGYLLLQGASYAASDYLNQVLPAQAGLDLRRELFAHALASRATHSTGTVIAQLTKQVDVAIDNYFRVLLQAPAQVAMLVFAAAGTLWISPVITLCVVAMSLPALLFPFLVKKALERASDRVVASVERYTAQITDALAGLTTIQHGLAQGPFAKRHDAANQVQYDTLRQDQRIQKITGGVTDFLGDMMYLGTWLVGAYFVQQGRITMGQLVAFSQLIAFLNTPMAELPEMMAKFYGARRVTGRLTAVLAAPVPTQPRQALALTTPLLAAEAADAGAILHDITLTVAPGQKVLLVGASGSGKTSLVRLLLGETAPTVGTVTLAGQAPTTLNPADIFGLIGVLDQQPAIFAATLRDNVTLLAPGYSDAQVQAALDAAGLGAWRRERSLDAVVSATSANLSGGERQRLALARLLLRKTQFFVFDELTTGLDPQIAATLQADLMAMPQGLLLITHQYSAATFAAADRVLVMQGGRLIASGRANQPAVQAALRELGMLVSA